MKEQGQLEEKFSIHQARNTTKNVNGVFSFCTGVGSKLNAFFINEGFSWITEGLKGKYFIQIQFSELSLFFIPLPNSIFFMIEYFCYLY
jgi:hypothetical protein